MFSFLQSAAILIVYYLFFLFALPVAFRSLLSLHSELPRKFQHVAFACSIFVLLELFSTWIQALLSMGILFLVAFPFLLLMEKTSWYHRCMVDRCEQGGEMRRQLLYVLLSYCLLITVFWGFHSSRWHFIIAASVMAWGLGDAAAALVGKFLGRYRIRHALLSGAKTFEGSGAMFFWSGVGIFLTLWLYGEVPWTISLLAAGVTAPVCSFAELISPQGTDTLTVPWSAAAVLTLLWTLLSLGGIV